MIKVRTDKEGIQMIRMKEEISIINDKGENG
jgi:hypothetical protein